LIISAYFALAYGFTLGKWVFFGLFSLPQNLKMASYKGYRVSGRSKKTKKNVVIADFSKIETRLKALYVRKKGIPEGGLKAL
jgi:hypothetical protein